MRCLLGAAALTVLLVPLCAATPLASSVPGTDPDANRQFATLPASLGYVDANGDGKPTATAPAEPLYFDTDHDMKVSYGDLRLTAFGAYPAGSTVDIGNRDFALVLAASPGWFATDAHGALVADADNTGTLTPGDVRMATGERVTATSTELDSRLTGLQPNAASANRIGLLDTNGNWRLDAGEAMYLDSNLDGRVGPGDWRFALGVPAADDIVSHAELDAVAKGQYTPADGTSPVAPVAGSAWRPLDWILVALAVANLCALAILVRAVQQVRPKNPFQ